MFNGKSKSDVLGEAPVGASTSLIGAGTSMKGDITSNGDLRIDGTLVGNINCSAKVVIGANGVVQGDINGQQADIMGKVTGTIKVKDLLQLKGGSHMNGNIQAAKLQIEPAANFNGECHMTAASTNGSGASVAARAIQEARSQMKHADVVATAG
ncbi:MAG: polymer-forming cytoskeletal protein [Bacteroidota bacterium]|nr:polymer-forming cytoskeletal protein [Bacteroidota bacterium]MDP4218250.1 polymer-forming cytoskeletal protein [Bacteroidota bacterium]MDP4247759.1 polymer-forming cytoskeletal protein [Bacteroidota bacterium]MDP4253533.1 polymer-forming cytoskeletal protein [Bacteroidota bacterium]MDP4257059.1 polymer-forming cytoskeletal protein [Bacteroidota bacterium]